MGEAMQDLRLACSILLHDLDQIFQCGSRSPQNLIQTQRFRSRFQRNDIVRLSVNASKSNKSLIFGGGTRPTGG